MKPLGQKPKKHNFEDSHPQKGYKNWWDDICSDNKAADKQNARKHIKSQIGNECKN